MKKTLLAIGACFALFSSNAQTQLFFEDFESTNQFTLNTTDVSSTSTGANDWVVNNSYTGGSVLVCGLSTVVVAATPAQPGGISSANGNYAHIVSDDGVSAGVTNANFVASDGGLLCVNDENIFMRMTSDISTTGYDNVEIDFWWLCGGSTANYGELYYSTDGGSSWVLDNTTSQYFNQSNWQNQNIANVAWDNQAQLRFGFRFANLFTFAATDPSFAVDDIEISGTPACTNTTNSFSVSQCDSYTVPSGDETYTTAGTQTVMDTIPNNAGCDSILTISLTLGVETTNSITETACGSYTVPSGDETYTTVGTSTVMDTIPNMAGCDSVLTISLTINDVDPSVTDNMDGSLTADASGATYQWLENCDGTPTPISGETNQTFSFSGVGWFSCIVTQNGCSDTSDCIYGTSQSIDEFDATFDIYPNPSTGDITLDLSSINGQQQMNIADVNGKLVANELITGGSQLNYSLNVEAGVYIISLTDKNGIVRRSKLIIE
jgi:hypothetical protein